MTPYEKLKEVIQGANPKKVWFEIRSSGREGIRDGRASELPIRLADVLLAGNAGLVIDSYGYFWKFTHGGNPDYIVEPYHANWNLKEDNLDHQPEETKSFLINLLVHA